ncbi:MAG TPA: aminotransferase class I/II-fold pyridoxal phosphate-dependent enzyme [Acidimicrobiales bacterium]|nr:aminotransferase class I/II-fold pyridoxal phosphate-dependent enzyme [Acidimicrobiales bacterium]
MSRVPPARAHGGDGARVARALGMDPNEILDLSQSLNPVAPDPRPIVAAHLDALGRYPDPAQTHESLAAAMNVDPDRLLLTNGGAEAIALVASEMGGFVHEPEFSLHPRGDGPRWRSNPHSPTGMLAGPTERADVWDEAFYPLATGRWSRGDEEAVVVGSLTKLLACPGLRVGYVLADQSLIERCRRRQPEWSLNGLAAEALPDFLSSLDLERDCVAVRALRERLRVLFERRGLRVRPSDAPWLLIEFAGLRELLAPEGIVVRDCASFGLAGVTRVAVPNEEGLERLDRALDKLGREIEESNRRRRPADDVTQ